MSNHENVYKAPLSRPSAAPRSTSGLAITSLVLGIASFFCIIFTGLPAIILGIIGLSKISGSNGRVGGSGMAIAGIVTGALGCLWSVITIAIMLPAVQQVRTAARRTQSMNQVRQLCLANLNYESANRRFPSNISASNPEAGENLSWRVHILPQLGRQDLYDRFNLEEPWDSPTNKALLAEMPDYYVHPQVQDKLPTGYTVFQMPSSPADSEAPAMLVEGEQGVTFAELTDGSSNTILILEVAEAEAVPWTKPQDWQFDPDDPARGVGDSFPGTFTAGMCDGSTHAIDRSMDGATLGPLFTRSAGDTAPMMY